jgi:hypothetical protein
MIFVTHLRLLALVVVLAYPLLVDCWDTLILRRRPGMLTSQ